MMAYLNGLVTALAFLEYSSSARVIVYCTLEVRVLSKLFIKASHTTDAVDSEIHIRYALIVDAEVVDQ